MNSAATKEPQKPVAVKEKMKSRPGFIVLSVLLLLALAGTGLLGYMVYTQNQTVNTANAEIKRLFNENTQLKNIQSTEGRDFVNESAIDATTIHYLMANGEYDKNPVIKIEYLDKGYAFARVVVYENLGKTDQGVQEGNVLHTFIFKSVLADAQADKSWVIVGIDANNTQQQKTIQDEFDVPAVVFTENNPA